MSVNDLTGQKNLSEKINQRESTTIETFGDEQETKNFSPKIRDITPLDRLLFAKWVLRGIFIFFIMSTAVWLYEKNCGSALMEICRTGLLPIASFVIGDYFGSRGN